MIRELVPENFQVPFMSDDSDVKHYGMENCGAPMGSPEYRRLWLTQKANKICESIRNISSSLSMYDAHAAYAAINYSLQSRSDFILQLYSHEETDSFRASIQKSLFEAYNIVSNSNILTANENEKDTTFVRDRLFLRTSKGGLGYRDLNNRFLFSNNLNSILPQTIDQINEETGEIVKKGLWNSLSSILGTNSFDQRHSSERWKKLYESNIPTAQSLKAEWERIKTSFQNLVTDNEMVNLPSTLKEGEQSFGHGIKKLSKVIRDQFQELQTKHLEERAQQLRRDDPRRVSFLSVRQDPIATSLLQGTPSNYIKMSSSEFRDAFTNYLGLSSPSSATLTGSSIPTHQNSRQLLVDKYGYNVKTANGMKGDNIRIMHDSIHDLLTRELSAAKILTKGSPSRPIKNVFAHLINPNASEEHARHVQGIIPDILITVTKEVSIKPTFFDNTTTITDIKTLSPGQHYTNIDNLITNQAVNNREEKVNADYYAHATTIDSIYNNTPNNTPGPVQQELRRYGKNGKVIGLIIGSFGDCSRSIHELIKLISRENALMHIEYFNMSFDEAFNIHQRILRKKLSLQIAKEWAKVTLDRIAQVANKKYSQCHSVDEEIIIMNRANRKYQ